MWPSASPAKSVTPKSCSTRSSAGHFREHGQAAADVKTADGHGKTLGTELPRQVDGPGELVRLHAGQDDQSPAALGADAAGDLAHRNDRVGFVVRVDHQVEVLAQGGVARRPGPER